MAVDLVELVDQRQGKRFLCTQDNTCQKSFTRKSDLLRHERIHTGEKPYGCSNPECGKSFRQQSALNVHSRTHTGEKPFVCKFADCGKRFADSSSLSRHHKSNTHGGKTYSCRTKDCGKAFARKNSLRRHLERCGNTLHVLSSAQTSQSDVGNTNHVLASGNNASEAVLENQPPQLQRASSQFKQPQDFANVDYAKQHHDLPWDAHKQDPTGWSHVPAQGLALSTDVVDYGVVVPGHDVIPSSHYSNPQALQRVAESNASQIFVTEHGNPGIATMNADAIPQSYYTGGHQDYAHAIAHASAAVDSPAHQGRAHDYTLGQDDAGMSATSSFHGHIEDDCFSPHSTHSAATSFCEVPSPNPPSGQFDAQFYTHQVTQQRPAVPPQMSFGPLLVDGHHENNHAFAMQSYHCQPYL